MKLFITNKREFEKQFDDPSRFENTFFECFTTSKMHKDLFNQLFNQINVENSIPTCLTTPYGNGEGVAIFDFITKKDEVYYYQYSATAL